MCKQSYDTIDREELWAIMTQYGFSFKLIRLLKATLQDVKCCLKIQGILSGSFESRIGLRQGDELSTKLFNVALEGIVRRSKVQTTGSIFNKSIQLLGYADDIDIIGRKMRSLTDAFSRLEREANRIGLHVNESKTKLMMIRPSQRNRALLGKHLEVGDKKFEVVEEFPYLGVLVNNKFDTKIKRRILSAQRAFYGVSHILSSQSITQNTKFTMYSTLICPAATYGVEFWNTTVQNEEKLGVLERRVLRRIIGPMKVSDGVYRQRWNHELYQVYKDSDINSVVRHLRLSWLDM
jgi:Reverse transcriptase (RNA-dependent DNA polymerase)